VEWLIPEFNKSSGWVPRQVDPTVRRGRGLPAMGDEQADRGSRWWFGSSLATCAEAGDAG